MKDKITAIIPAAGLGKRFGKAGSKIFRMLLDKPVLIRTLLAFEAVPGITEVIPVLKDEDIKEGERLIKEYGLKKIRRISAGGRERQDSVYRGLKLINDKPAAVIVHDGARPMVDKTLIQNAIKGLKGVDGVIACVPPKDTIKEAESLKAKEIIVKKTLNRKDLWSVQTPQAFRYSVLKSSYEKAMREGFYSTDDSAIVERYGGRVKIITGSYTNIKITTPEDIYIAEAILGQRGLH